MQFDDGKSLYELLNQALRTENRGELKTWFSYLKLFLTALHKLPSQSGTVWRGIRDVDLSSKYKTGKLNPAPQLHIIQLKEITPPIPLVKPPFQKSSPVFKPTPKIKGI
ncbi:unnamed protein product, partial [Rotaria sp. Silwood1]